MSDTVFWQIAAAQKLVQGWDEENQQRNFEATDELQQSAVDLSLQLAAACAGLQVLSQQIDSHEWSFTSAEAVSELESGGTATDEPLEGW